MPRSEMPTGPIAAASVQNLALHTQSRSPGGLVAPSVARRRRIQNSKRPVVPGSAFGNHLPGASLVVMSTCADPLDTATRPIWTSLLHRIYTPHSLIRVQESIGLCHRCHHSRPACDSIRRIQPIPHLGSSSLCSPVQPAAPLELGRLH